MSERILIPNSCQVPNVLLDVAMARLGPVHWKVLCAVVRLTFGYGKREDRISLSQITKLTGGSRSHACAAIVELEGAGLLVRRRATLGRLPAVHYSLNLEFDATKLVPHGDQCPTGTSAQRSTKLVPHGDTPNPISKPITGSPKNGSPAGRAPRSKTKPVADPRHAPIRAAIADAYAQANSGAKIPWDASEAQQLDRWLRANPSVTLPAALAMVQARFASDVNHAERPRRWLANLADYRGGALDKYRQPKATAAPRPTEYLRPQRRQGGLT
ncbi:MAG TPA: replication protein [Terriglobales bacterium]|nr:replication protein [Terriglobales bacterium]